MDETLLNRYMSQALSLAAKGSGLVAPNPMVGAVIVKDNKVIGQGYHEKYGEHHAEVNAINNCRALGNDPANSTIFVTLEPCCHYGKTPPCTQAIIDASIKHVEVATIDDFAQVKGKGIQKLRDAGIEVNVGICEKEARYLNAGFFKLQDKAMPLVTLKWAQSKDGFLAWPKNSSSRWITNESSRHHVHQMRKNFDAILVGIGTVLADDPMLDIRLDEPVKQKPKRIILDSLLRIPTTSKLAQSASETPVIIYTLTSSLKNNAQKAKELSTLDCTIQPVKDAPGGLDLCELLKDLARKGVAELMVEGGAKVLRSFHSQQLADRIITYTAPVIIGGDLATCPHFMMPENITNIRKTSFESDTLIEADLTESIL